MENKKKRTGLLLSVLGVLSLVLITAGVTYAFFNYAKEGQTPNTISTGTIEFAYTENAGIGNGIAIQNAMPTADATGKGLDTTGDIFRFTVTSKTPSSARIPYTVTLNKTEGILGDNQVKVYLEAAAGANATTTDSYIINSATDHNYTVNNDTLTDGSATVKTFAQLTGYTLPGTNSPSTTEKIIYTGTVPANATAGVTYSFVLRMWLSNTGNDMADYSPYEFMLKSAATQPQSGDTAADVKINADTAISAGNFITSTAYYELSATKVCSNNTYTTQSACEGANETWASPRDAYERIAFVNMTDRTVLTVSQAVALGHITNQVQNSETLPNYTVSSTPQGYTSSEQFYRINGAEFTAKVNVYANGEKVSQ